MNHDKMSNISAKRGFLWPSFEIYSGVSGFTDYVIENSKNMALVTLEKMY